MNVERIKEECPVVYEACVERFSDCENPDQRISELSPLGLMRQVCGWFLGEPGWANNIIESYEQLKKIEAES